MPTLLDSLTTILTPRQSEQLAKMLDVKTAQLSEGIQTSGALLLGAANLQAAAPEGADALLASLTQDTELHTDVMHSIEEGHGYPILDFLFGVGLPKVTQWVKDTAGMDVAPYLAATAVLFMRALHDVRAKDNLDAVGLGAYLQKEQETLARAQPQLASQLSAAIDLGKNTTERAERLMERFAPEEWDALAKLPAIAASAVIMSDMSGPVGFNKEYTALFGALAAQASEHDPDSLVALAAMSYNEPAQVDALNITQANAQTQMRDASLRAVEILNDKCAHDEIVAYKKMVLEVARAVAQAALDGGTLGIGRKPISADERRTLDLLAAALAYSE